jgi:GT2 family glycosyltransferase
VRLLPACISSLTSQTYRDFTLLIIDNGSTDGSLRLLQDLDAARAAEWFDGELPRPARLIANTANLGFAEANNQAFRLALSEGFKYIATLNNDAVAEPGWLGALVEAAESGHASTGMVASTMLFAHRPKQVASAGITVYRDGVALDRGVGVSASELERAGVRPVFGPSAGAALYRVAMLRDVGLFDTRFFSYLEDADLAWRARARGWRAVHTPFARVLHEYSATGGEGSSFKRRLMARNRIWLLYKNLPTPLLLRYAPQIARYDLAASLSSLLARNTSPFTGRIEGLRGLGQFAQDRRLNMASARLHPEELSTLLLPPLSPRAHARFRRRLQRLLDDRPEV